MILKRKADEAIDNWVKNHNRKCLLIRGPRQVGKTFSIEQYGNAHFEHVNEINFIKQPEAINIFSENLDVDMLVMNLQLYYPQMIFTPGNTLLFLDEIQECPKAITSLKFWAQDNRYTVIASGSMLGIDYKRPTSYPVGSIDYLDMYGLDFEEFLWANGVSEKLIETLADCFTNLKTVPEPINRKMMELMRLYLALGGMPAVVTNWLETLDMARTDAVQRAILSDYRYDIAHYAAPEIKIKAEDCYFSLPDQLSKPNHKFQYSVVSKAGSARKYENSIDWLSNAYLVKYCYNVSIPEYPLHTFRTLDNFRLYPTDIGMLTGMFDYSLKRFLIAESDTNNILKTAKGGMYEALIADMLMKNKNRELYFYKKDNASLEVEFLLSSEQGIIPVEVKSTNSRSKSLDKILENKDIRFGYKLIDGNVGATDKKRTIPLYMAMFL